MCTYIAVACFVGIHCILVERIMTVDGQAGLGKLLPTSLTTQ